MRKPIDLPDISRFLAKCRSVFYSKPKKGIPKDDLAKEVKDSLRNADAAYIAPEGEIPYENLDEEVQYYLYYSLLMDTVNPPYSDEEKAAGMENLGVPVRPGAGLYSVIQKDNGDFANTATGARAAAFGAACNGAGVNSFATGYQNTSEGVNTLTSGRGNTAKADNSFIGGIYSVVDPAVLFTMGVGTKNARKNSLVIKTDGKVYIDGIGGYSGLQTLANQPSAKDVKSVIDELKPLIVEGSFSQATQGASFAPNPGQPSKADAIAAFLAGRRVVLKGEYVSATNFGVSVVSVDEDSQLVFGYIYSGALGGPDECVWD